MIAEWEYIILNSCDKWIFRAYRIVSQWTMAFEHAWTTQNCHVAASRPPAWRADFRAKGPAFEPAPKAGTHFLLWRFFKSLFYVLVIYHPGPALRRGVEGCWLWVLNTF